MNDDPNMKQAEPSEHETLADETRSYREKARAIVKEVGAGQGWRLRDTVKNGRVYTTKDGLMVVVTADREDDSNWWIHVGVGRKKRWPSIQQFSRVLRELFGEGYAHIMWAVPDEEDCRRGSQGGVMLHAFRPLKVEGMPDFTKGNEGL